MYYLLYNLFRYKTRTGNKVVFNKVEIINPIIKEIAIGFKNGPDEKLNKGSKPKIVVIEVNRIWRSLALVFLIVPNNEESLISLIKIIPSLTRIPINPIIPINAINPKGKELFIISINKKDHIVNKTESLIIKLLRSSPFSKNK